MTLTERLRSGTGADRELDAELALHFGWHCKEYGPDPSNPKLKWRLHEDDCWWSTDENIPPALTSDLNAVFALVERELGPEVEAWHGTYTKQERLVKWGLRAQNGWLWSMGVKEGGVLDVSTHCRALLLALLAAKEGK